MIEQPNLAPCNDKEYYLRDPFTYEWVFNDRLYRVVIPMYWVTDLASVPRAFWSIVRPDGLVNAAALIHDFFYCFRGYPPIATFQRHTTGGNWVNVTYSNKPDGDKGLTREECDNLFLQLMLDAGVGGFKANLMYKSVRFFGGLAW